MKYAIVATIVTVFMVVILLLAFLGFLSSYGDSSASFRDIVGNGMLFLSFLIVACIITQLFFVWVFANQVEKLRKTLDAKTDELKLLRNSVNLLKDDIDLLL